MRIIGSLLLIAFFSCTRNAEDDGQVTLTYQQTQCSDRWGYASTETELAYRVDTFLTNRNLHASEISFRQANIGAVCLACVCPTGRLIDVKVANRQSLIDSFEMVGFR